MAAAACAKCRRGMCKSGTVCCAADCFVGDRTASSVVFLVCCIACHCTSADMGLTVVVGNTTTSEDNTCASRAARMQEFVHSLNDSAPRNMSPLHCSSGSSWERLAAGVFLGLFVSCYTHTVVTDMDRAKMIRQSLCEVNLRNFPPLEQIPNHGNFTVKTATVHGPAGAWKTFRKFTARFMPVTTGNHFAPPPVQPALWQH